MRTHRGRLWHIHQQQTSSKPNHGFVPSDELGAGKCSSIVPPSCPGRFLSMKPVPSLQWQYRPSKTYIPQTNLSISGASSARNTPPQRGQLTLLPPFVPMGWNPVRGFCRLQLVHRGVRGLRRRLPLHRRKYLQLNIWNRNRSPGNIRFSRSCLSESSDRDVSRREGVRSTGCSRKGTYPRWLSERGCRDHSRSRCCTA